MLVSSLAHARMVVASLRERTSDLRSLEWLVIDTETEAQAGRHPDDALLLGRADIRVFSLAALGETYCLPTCLVSPSYPTPLQWLRGIFNPLMLDNKVLKVFHNANYDVGQMLFMDMPLPTRVHCSMIGAWKTNADIPKGLKERAVLYGRQLRKTHNVKFSNLDELATYAEEDALATDELFQMQRFGYVHRNTVNYVINKDGRRVVVPQPMPAGRLVIPHEGLSPRDKHDLAAQEFAYLRVNLRGERRGVYFDIKGLDVSRKIALADRDKHLRKFLQLAGRDINLNSPAQLASLFDEVGIVSPETTRKGKASFAAHALTKLQGTHPLVDSLAAYRKVQKLVSTYIGDPAAVLSKRDQGFPSPSQMGMAYYCDDRGYIHATSNPVGADTGRTSSSGPNLTNIPARADVYFLRKRFRAPGHASIICLDYGGLELRVDTLLSKDPTMTRILNDPKGDLHRNTAEEFGIPRDPAAKQVNFLLIYGGKKFMLSEQLTFTGYPCTQDKADAIIVKFDQVYPGPKELRMNLLAEYRQKGYVRLFTGRRRWFARSINWDNEWEVHKLETQLANNVVQGTGQDFLKAAIIRSDPAEINPDRYVLNNMVVPDPLHRAWLRDAARRLTEVRRKLRLMRVVWLFQVHDESLWYCYDRKAEQDAAHLLANLMTWRHFFPATSDYNVPLVAEGGIGLDWHEAKSKQALYHVKAGF